MRLPQQPLGRRAAAALLPLVAGACTSLQPVPVRFISETNPAVVYLSDGFGVTQAVAHPRLSGDTVRGTAVGANREIAVPLTEVERVATVRVNRGRTVLLVGGLAAAAGLMVYTVLAQTGKETAFFCDYNNPNPNTSPDAPQCGFPTN